MGMNKNSLGDRMKRYESVSSSVVGFRTPVIIRLDGKAFHTYTKGFEKPWDRRLQCAMTDTCETLMEEVQGCKVAYTQSDEISLLLTDYGSIQTQPWFDNKIQKMVSVSASIATFAFNKSMEEQGITGKRALFDSRVFSLPKEEVNNYFCFRQQDSQRNSISSLAQSLFSHKQLQGLSANQMQDLMLSEKGINWNNIETRDKRGWCISKKLEPTEGTNPQTGLKEAALRTLIKSDFEIPIFSQDRDYINNFVYSDKERE